MTPTYSTAEVIDRLAEAAGNEPCVLGFDGDGTLWSGDVSDDVFFEACRAEWLLDDARLSIEQALATGALTPASTLGQSALRLHQAHEDGLLPERLLFEAMTYCYAGRTATELTAYAATVLNSLHIEQRIRTHAHQLLDWARKAGHQCYLVTASPGPIVAVPARTLGFDEAHIIASSATNSLGLIGYSVERSIPYLEQKVLQLAERCPNRRLLAAFGDSPFDIPMLNAASIAVAVEPKPKLIAKITEIGAPSVFCWLPNQ